MAASALHAELVNVTFQSVSSDVTLYELQAWWFQACKYLDKRYHRQSQQLRIVDNLSNNHTSETFGNSKSYSAFNAFLMLYFKRTMLDHILLRTFFSAHQIQLLLWPAYSADMSPFKHVCGFVGRRLTSCSWYRWILGSERSNLECSSSVQI